MQKAYQRINWENAPSENTPVNEENLNKLDFAMNELDNRTINLDITKAEKTELSTLIAEIEFNEITGVITFTRKNGSQIILDTKLEKLAVNFGYNQETEKLVITLSDGTIQYVDLSALITLYEFLDSDTIAFRLEGGKVRAIVKAGSIKEEHLQPNYLADIIIQVEAATQKASEASEHASAAEDSYYGAKEAENNARLHENNAASARDIALEASADATEMVADVTEKLENGYFVGPMGPQGSQGIQGPVGPSGERGPQGIPGESGAVVPISGMFTLSGDADGNLWAYYSDEDNPPEFETDEDGNIYYVIAE